ncbi:MAG: DMT family transporter [Alphaproteobacteria bacterium]|nr:DMT family transporter [Alphaproteobacteria bacterium SS10]
MPEPAAEATKTPAARTAKSLPDGAPEQSMKRALLWLGIAMVGVVGINTWIKEITQHLHPFEVVFWRNLFAVALILPFLILRYGRHALTLNKPKPVIIRGGVEFLIMATLFSAFSQLPLAQAVAIVFTMPIWITIGAALFLGEVVRARRWIATGVGFIGMLVIIGPNLGSPSIYHLAAFAAAILIGVSTLMLRNASLVDSPGRIVCWMSIVITPLAAIAAIPVWQGPTPMVFGMLICAVLCGTTAHVCLTQSMRYAEASQTAPYRYVELIMAAIMGFIIFGEVPALTTYIGAAIITASGIYIAHREHVARMRDAEKQ